MSIEIAITATDSPSPVTKQEKASEESTVPSVEESESPEASEEAQQPSVDLLQTLMAAREEMEESFVVCDLQHPGKCSHLAEAVVYLSAAEKALSVTIESEEVLGEQEPEEEEAVEK